MSVHPQLGIFYGCFMESENWQLQENKPLNQMGGGGVGGKGGRRGV